jgi:hypothetical protein
MDIATNASSEAQLDRQLPLPAVPSAAEDAALRQLVAEDPSIANDPIIAMEILDAEERARGVLTNAQVAKVSAKMAAQRGENPRADREAEIMKVMREDYPRYVRENMGDELIGMREYGLQPAADYYGHTETGGGTPPITQTETNGEDDA